MLLHVNFALWESQWHRWWRTEYTMSSKHSNALQSEVDKHWCQVNFELLSRDTQRRNAILYAIYNYKIEWNIHGILDPENIFCFVRLSTESVWLNTISWFLLPERYVPELTEVEDDNHGFQLLVVLQHHRVDKSFKPGDRQKCCEITKCLNKILHSSSLVTPEMYRYSVCVGWAEE